MKNKTTQGLGNKKLLSFPKHDTQILKTRKQCQQSYVNTLYYILRGRYQLGFYPVSPPVANIVIFVTNVNKFKNKFKYNL
jgi:hypothetical protein